VTQQTIDSPQGQRVPPVGAPGDYKTFAWRAPVATHFRRATCAEVGCLQWHNGWRLRVEGLEPRDLHLAKTCGRKFSELEISVTEHWLVFEAGQACFKAAAHRTRIDKPEIFVVRGGDWRARIGDTYRHASVDDWVDEMANHQDKIVQLIERG
jgi:hypothetical protein